MARLLRAGGTAVSGRATGRGPVVRLGAGRPASTRSGPVVRLSLSSTVGAGQILRLVARRRPDANAVRLAVLRLSPLPRRRPFGGPRLPALGPGGSFAPTATATAQQQRQRHGCRGDSGSPLCQTSHTSLVMPVALSQPLRTQSTALSRIPSRVGTGRNGQTPSGLWKLSSGAAPRDFVHPFCLIPVGMRRFGKYPEAPAAREGHWGAGGGGGEGAWLGGLCVLHVCKHATSPRGGLDPRWGRQNWRRFGRAGCQQ